MYSSNRSGNRGTVRAFFHYYSLPVSLLLFVGIGKARKTQGKRGGKGPKVVLAGEKSRKFIFPGLLEDEKSILN